MKRSMPILLLLLGSGLLSMAQERLDVFTLSGRYGLPSSYDSIYAGKATETGLMAALAVPVPVSEKSIWYNSLNYFYWHVRSDEQMPEDLIDPIRVHGFILRTGLYQKLGGGRALQLLLAPRFMTDMQHVDSDHLQWGGLALYDKRYRDDLLLGFGVMYNQELFGPYVVPLVNLDWKISERWSVTGLLPVYGKVKYQFSERLDGGYSHFGLITTYRLGDPAYQGDYLERSSIDETLYLRYRLFGDIFVEGRLGYALGRHYRQYAADQKVDFSLPLIGFGDDRVAENVSVESGFIGSLRIVYSINLKEIEGK